KAFLSPIGTMQRPSLWARPNNGRDRAAPQRRRVQERQDRGNLALSDRRRPGPSVSDTVGFPRIINQGAVLWAGTNEAVPLAKNAISSFLFRADQAIRRFGRDCAWCKAHAVDQSLTYNLIGIALICFGVERQGITPSMAQNTVLVDYSVY